MLLNIKINCENFFSFCIYGPGLIMHILQNNVQMHGHAIRDNKNRPDYTRHFKYLFWNCLHQIFWCDVLEKKELVNDMNKDKWRSVLLQSCVDDLVTKKLGLIFFISKTASSLSCYLQRDAQHFAILRSQTSIRYLNLGESLRLSLKSILGFIVFCLLFFPCALLYDFALRPSGWARSVSNRFFGARFTSGFMWTQVSCMQITHLTKPRLIWLSRVTVLCHS